MMRQYYTYIYFDKSKPIYIGKGYGRRAYKHLKYGCDHNSHFHNKLRKMLSEQNEPIIKIIPVNNEDEAFELEKFLIQEIGRYDLNKGTLLNHTNGGDGSTGYNHLQESKEKMRKLKNGMFFGKDNPMYGKKRLDLKERNLKNNPALSEEAREKNRLWHTGRRFKQKTETCSVCNRTLGIGPIKRFHNEKCKVIL